MIMMIEEPMGERLKRLRESRGLTKYRLSKITGIGENYLSHLEKGNISNPRRDTLLALAKGLDMSLSELAGEAPISPIDTLSLVETSLRAYIPVYSEVSAGPGIEPIDYVACTRVKPAPETHRAYRVKGLCLHPDIRDGDTIIVDTSLSPSNGDLIVGIIDGEASVKKYHDTGEDKWLENNNGTYRPEEVHVHGVVVESVHKWR